MKYPTPHGDKLRSLISNNKLPQSDLPRVRSAIERYQAWISSLVETPETGKCLIDPLTQLLTEYKNYIDLELVFDSEDDFLYRQKGQLKLDNTVVEEFLPVLVGRVFEERLQQLDLTIGPLNSLSQLTFDVGQGTTEEGPKMKARSKDQDFVVGRPIFIRASHSAKFDLSTEVQTHLAIVAAEIKTNLDKTMFQEADATAGDLRLTLPNSKYFLICEWLDMTPINTSLIASVVQWPARW